MVCQQVGRCLCVFVIEFRAHIADTNARTSYWSPIIASSFFRIGTSLMFQAALNYLPGANNSKLSRPAVQMLTRNADAYPRFVASVLASNDFTRSMSAGAFPLFASAMFKRLGIDWGNSLLGFLSVIMIPIPFVLYKVRVSGSTVYLVPLLTEIFTVRSQPPCQDSFRQLELRREDFFSISYEAVEFAVDNRMQASIQHDPV